MRSPDEDSSPAPLIEILRDDGDARPSRTDLIESGPRARMPGWIRTPAVVVLLAMVIGGVAGYLVGHRPAAKPESPSAESATSVGPGSLSVPVVATGNRCAVQQGPARLQLGVELLNQSTTVVILHPAHVVLPLNGMKIRTVTWGGCGQLNPAASFEDRSLPPGGLTWLNMTFDVLVACPGALPVQLTLDYTQAGRPGVVDLLPFPDLGDVPYTSPSCPPGS